MYPNHIAYSPQKEQQQRCDSFYHALHLVCLCPFASFRFPWGLGAGGDLEWEGWASDPSYLACKCAFLNLSGPMTPENYTVLRHIMTFRSMMECVYTAVIPRNYNGAGKFLLPRDIVALVMS